MKKVRIFLTAISFLIISASNSQAKVKIFACEPEWQSLAKEIGGNYVATFSATSANQDPHHIRARPRLIARIRNADLLICSGADLETGWLPILMSRSNKNIQFGKVGYLMAADFVKTIEKPKVLDRSLGDIHAQGNPHIHLDPRNITIIAKELTSRLQKIDPKNSEKYQENYNNFFSKWTTSIKEWEKKSSNLKNLKVIVHHKSFSYLIKWLQLEEIATLEPKPGIAPTINHLTNLLKKVKNDNVELIIRTPYDPKKPSNWLSKKTNIKQITLPFTINGNEESRDLFALFENTISLISNSKSK